jgi:hypothetical protein
MHRPPSLPERSLQRATWLVYSPFASAEASAHYLAHLAVRSIPAVSVLGLQPLERLPHLRPEPANHASDVNKGGYNPLPQAPAFVRAFCVREKILYKKSFYFEFSQ